MKPQYIIIGGVNGAGKSTLYRTNPQIFGATRRLNADEKLRAAGGDWRNPADAARAMRDTVQDLAKRSRPVSPSTRKPPWRVTPNPSRTSSTAPTPKGTR